MTFLQILYVFITVGCVFLLGVGAAVLYDQCLKSYEKRHKKRKCRKCHKEETIKRSEDDLPL